jgi:glycosyltransferase involved in cell wall biosynthesis
MPNFSVIIPIYKVEFYLEKCIRSILQQTFRNFEIILVDDGSPDNCPQICDKLSQEDHRIKVIHKVNGGLSSARNEGMDLALGDYLIFLDSDDYWEGIDVLEKLYRKVSNNINTEVLIYGCKDYDVKANIISVSRIGYDEDFIESAKKEDVIQYLFQNNLFPGAAWIVMVKNSFVKQHNIYFELDIKAEDIDWLINVFSNAKHFDALNESFYIYLKNRTDSITGTSGISSIRSILFTIDKWFPILSEKKTISSEWFLNFLTYHYLTTILVYSKLEREDKFLIEKKLKEYKYILNYAKASKVKFGAFIINLFGIPLASLLFRKIKNK